MVAHTYFSHKPASCPYCDYLGDYGVVKLFFCTIPSDSVRHSLAYMDSYLIQYSDGRLYMTEVDGRLNVIAHALASEIDEMDSPVGLVEAKRLALRKGWLRENVSIPGQTGRRWSNSCPHCKFLGRHTIYDLYYCDIAAIPSVVLCSEFLAHTSLSIDYVDSFINPSAQLVEAKRRAIEQGWLRSANASLISISTDTASGDALDRIRG